MREIVGLLDPCNQRGGAQYPLRGELLDHCKGGVRDIVCAGCCWTAAIKEGVRDIVCAGGLLDCCNQIKMGRAISSARGGGAMDPCNQRGGARHRLQGGVRNIVCAGGAGPQSKGGCAISFARGLLDPCNQRGRAGYRLRGGVLDPCNQIKGWVRDIVCAGACWTAAIKEGLREIVCTGGC